MTPFVRHPLENPNYDLPFVFEFGLILCIEDIGIFLPEALNTCNCIYMKHRMTLFCNLPQYIANIVA